MNLTKMNIHIEKRNTNMGFSFIKQRDKTMNTEDNVRNKKNKIPFKILTLNKSR